MHTQTPATTADSTGAAERFARVLPLAFITYSLAYLDRVNIGFGETGSMREALHLTKGQFGFFSASFFIGYVLFQIPGAAYAARGSVKRLMFWALVLWGIIASLTGVLTNFYLLVADRFLLGVVEGVVFPSLLVFLTHWFTKRERSRANTLLILGNPLTMLWASIVSGYVLKYFMGHPLFGLQGWQLMLLAEGLPTLVWAVLWLMLADDRPPDAKWLEPQKAQAVQATLDAEQRDVKHVRHYGEAFRDPQVILLCVQFFAWSVGIYGLNMWLPVILKEGSKLGVEKVGLLNSIPYFVGIIAMMVISTISDRILVRRAFVWPFMFLGAAAFLLSYWAGTAHFWIAFIGLVVAAMSMYAPYGPFWALIPEMVSRNVIGESLALINTIGAAGGFVGTYFVEYLNGKTGGYGASFVCLSSFLAAAGALILMVKTRVRPV